MFRLPRPALNATPRLRSRLLGGLASLALLTAGLAPAPVLAEEDDLGRLLVGLTALAVIGAALEEERAPPAEDPADWAGPPLHPDPQADAPRPVDDRWEDGRWQGERWDDDRWHPDPHRRPPARVEVAPRRHPAGARLPDVCAFEITVPGTGRRQGAVVYGGTCLARHGLGHALPSACAKPGWDYGLRDRVYSARCLRDFGYRTAWGR